MKNNILLSSLIACSVICTLVLPLSYIHFIYVDFIPSKDYTEAAKVYSYVIPIIIFITLIYNAVKMIGASIRYHFKLTHYLSSPFLFVLLIWVFSDMIQKGIPSVLHYTGATSSHVTYVIEKLSDTYHGGNGSTGACPGITYINHPVLGRYRVCNITRADWSRLQIGNNIKFFGKVSTFGIKYESYKIIQG